MASKMRMKKHHKPPTAIACFFTLSAPSVLPALMLAMLVMLQLGAQANLLQAASNETTPPDSARLSTTTTTTTKLTTVAANPASPNDITTTTLADQTEPVTSTLDSLGVNSDESLTTTAEAEFETATGDGGGGGGGGDGIEAKSISRNTSAINDFDAATSNEKESESGKLLSIESASQKASGVTAASSTSSSQVNMTQIDQIYTQAYRDEHETVASWQRMAKKLKRGIGGVIGAIVPMALNMSQEAKISNNCSGAMLKWVLSMNQLKSWALRMLDASGKPIAGLLEGSMTMFGNYRQCLKIRAPDEDEIEFEGAFKEYFRGKYCVIQAKPWLPEKSRFYNLNSKLESLMKPNQFDASSSASSDEAAPSGAETEPEASPPEYEKTVMDELSEWALAFNFVNIRFDLCVPSLCKREDIQKAVNYLLKGIDLKARVLRCEMDGFGAAASVESGSPEVAEAHSALAAASTMNQQSNGQQVSTAATTTTTTTTSNTYIWPESFSQLGWLLLPLIATSLVLIATALSMTFSTEDHESQQVLLGSSYGVGGSGGGGGGISGGDNSSSTGDRFSTKTVSAPARTRLGRAINSLSLKRSLDSHLNVDYDQLADDKPLSLYGVRFLLVLWVILVESAVNLKFEYLRELLMLKDLIFWWPMQFIINSTLQYDSFILLTAFTMGYKNCLNDGIDNAKALSRFVLDKYVRLMPSIMLMVALVILMPLAYRGPVWNDYVTTQSAVCQSTGWINSVFLQNYLPYKQICLPQTWLLCVEFQLILLMAPVVYYLNKSYTAHYGARMYQSANGNNKQDKPIARKYDSSKMFFWIWTAPGLILVTAIILSLCTSFYNVYLKELPPSWFYTMADPDSKAAYFGEHMTKIWTHLAVFALGLLAGVECRRAAKNVIRGYKSSNIDHITHDNLFTVQHKSQSSSATSLPIILAQNKSAQANDNRNNRTNGNSSSISAKATNDINKWQSSYSINISQSTTNASNERLDGGCQSIQNSHNLLTNKQNTNGAYDSCHIETHHINNHNNNHHHQYTDNINTGTKRRLFSILLDLIISLIAITTMALIIFSTHDWSLNDLPKPYVAGLFDAGSRFLWSLAMVWLLYMISVPNKDRSFSLLARSLGHPVMVCLGKLSFLIYIIHPFVHTAVLAIQEQPIYSSWLMLFHILIGNITITVILASLVSLFVEMPCRNIFRRCGTSLLLTQSGGFSNSGDTSNGTNSINSINPITISNHNSTTHSNSHTMTTTSAAAATSST